MMNYGLREKIRKEERAKTALEIYEMLHKRFMKTNNLEALDVIEDIQKEVLAIGVKKKK